MTLIEFIEGKLANAEKHVEARERGEATWREGTAKSWREAGCKLSKFERERLADMEHRIAAMFKAVLCVLKEKSQ